MLQQSMLVGATVKAPGFRHPGRVIGFIADDGGGWRIVVGHRIQGGDGEMLRRDYGQTELEIVQPESNAVLEACATALTARKGLVFRLHPWGLMDGRSAEAIADTRAVIEALADNLSQEMVDAGRDVDERRPGWMYYRRLDLVGMSRGRTRRVISAALKRAPWLPWTG
jgi:hypothetical protein